MNTSKKSDNLLSEYIGDKYDFFLNRLPLHKGICLVGYGNNGHKFYNYLLRRGIKVDCICDNQWERFEQGFPQVISINKGVQMYPDAIFVIPNARYRFEIQLQLLDLGIRNENIYLLCNESVTTKYMAKLPKKYYRELVAAQHYDETGIYPNLDSPKSFNEKMMAKMIEEPEILKVQLTDKYLVREWVSKKIGSKYLIPLLGVWKYSEDIEFSNLPSRYVLKANHGCGWNIIVNSQYMFSEAVMRLMLDDWLKANFAFHSYEMQYKQIIPKIICEEYIENMDNDVYDYKIFCFHGEPKYIMFLCERKKGLKMAFFDLNWKKQPFVYSYPRYDYSVIRPSRLEELLAVTRVLCKDFDQVRVDWYVLNDGTIKFGEMTFSSCAGHAAWEPKEWDMILGQEW